MPLLKVSQVTKAFGGVQALNGVDLQVLPGEIVGLIGPNGSGKTTLFICITGVLKPDGGSIQYLGRDITNLKPNQIALQRLARTFQINHVFPDFTVVENVMLAIQQHQEDSLWQRFLQTRRIRKFEAEARERAMELVESVGLAAKANAPASDLSYGQGKLLAFAMALAPRPSLVCLDEPASGVNQRFLDEMLAQINSWNDRGVGFLIIEHNMDFVMGLSHRMYALAEGRIIAQGSPDEVRDNPEVLDAYLGR